MLNLNAHEVRVLGALIEKEITTPEYYPLSLNAVVNASNQKSNREPVFALSEAEVRTALFELEERGLVRVLNDSRATKFEHLAYDNLHLRRPEIAVVGLLLLRGAQTAAELRMRAERMYSFDDTSAAAEVLERLAAREEPLVVKMPRQPGARESRWMHLLGGEVESWTGVSEAEASSTSNRVDARIEELERMVAELTARVERLESGDPSAS